MRKFTSVPDLTKQCLCYKMEEDLRCINSKYSIVRQSIAETVHHIQRHDDDLPSSTVSDALSLQTSLDSAIKQEHQLRLQAHVELSNCALCRNCINFLKTCNQWVLLA